MSGDSLSTGHCDVDRVRGFWGCLRDGKLVTLAVCRPKLRVLRIVVIMESEIGVHLKRAAEASLQITN